MDDTIVVGLDIGTTKIACFIGKRGSDPKKIKILGFGRSVSKGVRYGIVENLTVTAESIKEAVAEASQKANVDVEEVYIGVAGQHIHTELIEATTTIPDNTYQIISEDDLRNLEDTLRRTATIPEGHQIIHLFPQTYTVDGRELQYGISPAGVNGHVLKGVFNVVTGNKNEIQKLVYSVRMAGLVVKGIALEPVASSYAVLDEDDQRDGVALVDIGGGTTDIAVMIDGVVRFTSVLALAGDVITKDICENCRIVKRRAEQLKTHFGSCLPSSVNEDVVLSIPMSHNQPPLEIKQRSLAQIIKPRVESIFGMVSLELDESQLLDKLNNGMALTGGGSNMREIRELAELTTGIHCHIGRPGIHLEPVENTEEYTKVMDEYNNPMYATGIGLVIFGLMEEARMAQENTPKEDSKPEPQKEEPAESADAPSLEDIEESTPTPHDGNDNGNGSGSGRRKPFDYIAAWLKEQFVGPIEDN